MIRNPLFDFNFRAKSGLLTQHDTDDEYDEDDGGMGLVDAVMRYRRNHPEPEFHPFYPVWMGITKSKQ